MQKSSRSTTAVIERSQRSSPDDGYRLERIGPERTGPLPDLFRAVYGEDYIAGYCYDAHALAAAIAEGRQISFYALAPDGTLAGHLSLLRSAPNPHQWEVAQGLVHADHRRARLLSRLLALSVETAAAEPACQWLYGTALTNHQITQKTMSREGFTFTGLEIDYIPARVLADDGVDGPIATIAHGLDVGGGPAPHYFLPADLAPWAQRVLADAAQRLVVVAHAPEPGEDAALETVDMPRFDMARLTVHRPGRDLPDAVAALERAAEPAGRRTAQVVLALDRPESAWAIARLRAAGYAFSGFMPNFFPGGSHGGLFYRSFATPNFGAIYPLDDAGQWLLRASVRDWHTVTGRKSEALPTDLPDAASF